MPNRRYLTNVMHRALHLSGLDSRYERITIPRMISCNTPPDYLLSSLLTKCEFKTVKPTSASTQLHSKVRTAPTAFFLLSSHIRRRLIAIGVATREFFRRPTVRLTNSQRLLLDHRSVEALARRAGYWSAILLLSSVLVFKFGVADPANRHGLSKEMWVIVLWSLTLSYGYLLYRTATLPADTPSPKLRQLHLFWCSWLAIIAFWWSVGSLTLTPLPVFQIELPGNLVRTFPPALHGWPAFTPTLPGNERQASQSTLPGNGSQLPSPWRYARRSNFGLNQRSFFQLTLYAHVVSVLLLASSIFAVLAVLVFGVCLPYFFVQAVLIDPTPEWVPFCVFVYSMMAVILWRDHRTTLGRWITSEAERARANLFVSAISHDLRQPLTALALRIRSLRRKSASSEFLADIAALETQSKVLEHMINGALDISRLDAGTWQVQIRETALNLLIERVVSDLRPEALEKQILLVNRNDAYLVLTDPAALERILRNLIGNALRYTPQLTPSGAAGSIVVECEPRRDDICISVVDNGIGIPQNKLEDVFKEYVQLDNAARDRSKGFGLGLSIVKGLSALLGHKLEVTSTVGQGSRFSVYVPIAPRRGSQVLEPHADVDTSPDLRGTVVALIEDDEGSREALTTLLVEWGCYVFDGTSADEVLQKLSADEEAEVDFLLSDYRLMGDLTGIDAIHRVREALESVIPAAIWTAETSPTVLREIAEFGFEYLRKPPAESELITLLTKYKNQTSRVVKD
jgi:two-component system, sensor histidine kinase